MNNVLSDTTLIIPAKGAQDIAYAKELYHKAQCPRFTVEDLPYGAAVKQGIRLANTPFVATMDADGQHALQDINWLRLALAVYPEVDMVIGMRSTWEGRGLNVGLNLIASAFAKQWVPDFGSGLRIFRHRVVRSYLSILPDGFDFNAALTMCLLADDRPVYWHPIHVRDRQWGRSHVQWQDGGRALWQILRIGGALRTRRQRAWLRRIRSALRG